jgi:hypothetical protein
MNMRLPFNESKPEMSFWKPRTFSPAKESPFKEANGSTRPLASSINSDSNLDWDLRKCMSDRLGTYHAALCKEAASACY